MVTATEPRLYCVPTPPPSPSRAEAAPDGAPPGPWTLEAAYRYCERMAGSHYENFPVASRFMPAHLRKHVAAIYAFARTADDFADEPRYEGRRNEALDAWQGMLEDSYRREVPHPVFTALHDTVRRHNIPVAPLQALLTAFRMDQSKHSYASHREVLGYCMYSANPVGQLVLYIHGHREPSLHRFSDQICSALQIANFLQDLSVDIPRGRTYIPQEDIVHFGVRLDDLAQARHTPEFKEMMAFLVCRARSMFVRGRPLIRQVSPGLSMELDAIWRGGMKVLERIESLDYEVLDQRPLLGKGDFAHIAMRSLFSFGRRFLRGEA